MSQTTVSQRLESLMWDQRLSQNKFAKRIGVSGNTVSRIMRGETNPSLETIEQISAAFPNLNPVWLLKGEGNMYIFDGAPADALVHGLPFDETPAPPPVEVPGVNPILEELRLMRQELSRALKVIESQQELLRKPSGNRHKNTMPPLERKVA